MPIDGISAYFIAKDLNAELSEMRVDRVRQPGRFDILLGLRGSGKNYQLLISANPSGPRIHLLDQKQEVPAEAPMFCMLLRKHLQGGRLLSVETEDFERIFKLRFQTSNELGDRSEKVLLFECMGRHSNLILLNEDNIILDAIVHVDSRVNRFREVLPARPYAAPPKQNKRMAAEVLKSLAAAPSTGAALWADLDLRKPLEKALLECFAGFSPPLVSELVFLAGINSRQQAASLDASAWQRLTDVTVKMLERIVGADLKPSVFYRGERDTVPFDFHVFDLHLGKSKSFISTLEMLAYFFSKRDSSQRFTQKQAYVLKQVQNVLDHTQKMYLVHMKDYTDSKDFAALKEEGELILANLYRLEQAQSEIIVEDYYNGNQPRRIELNPHRSPSWNAQTRFARYNRLKRKNELADGYLMQDESDLAYLNSLIDSIEHAENSNDLAMIKDEMSQQKLFIKNEKQKSLKGLTFSQRKAMRRKGGGKAPAEALPSAGPRRYLSSDGIEILVGRNNLQNDKLSLKSAHKQDLWFHIQKNAGSHVILSCGQLKGEIPDRSIEEAAVLAAWFSRGSKASIAGSAAKTAVDYCKVSEVKKPQGAKPGMVIYDHYKTAYVMPRAPEDLLPQGQIL